jgi:protein-disulfide isomerase
MRSGSAPFAALLLLLPLAAPVGAAGDGDFTNELELPPDAPELGSPEAPIVMVEAVDFRCPYCAEQAAAVFDEIVARYVDPGIVRYVALDFPLPRHAEAERDAVAARCAGEQGAYWRAHRALLLGAGLLRIGPLDLAAFADAASVDAEALRACVDSGRHVAGVRAAASRAAAVRVTGTPTFLFGFPLGDGRTVAVERHLEGAVGLEPVVAAIEALRESLRQRALREVVDQ